VTELPEGKRGGPTSALFLARIVYAFNWYNVGAVLPLIGGSLSAGPVQLGIILGAFLVGAGVFQVPAGLASIRFGARRVSLFGLAVLGLAGLASAFSPNWETLAALRAVAGFGAAFFFAPALSLIASYYPTGRRGPVIGFYNGGFSIGGAVGLFGGAYLGVVGGWPLALGAGGAALLGVGALAAFVLPHDPTDHLARTARDLWLAGSGILRSRSIWALSLALTGFWAAIYLVAQDFVDYGVLAHPEWGLALTAALVTGLVLASFPGGPVGGWIAERGRDRRGLAAAFTLLSGFLVVSIPFAPLPLLVLVMVVLGFADGVVFAILYLIPSYLPESGGEGLALGVGVVNSIQVTAGSGLAVVFGVVVASRGYEAAWELIGLLTIALLPLLFWVRPSRALGGSLP
jgi:MFS family permease